MENTVLLKLDKSIYDTILSFGIDISKYVLHTNFERQTMDETEYLLSTPANKKALEEAISSSKNKENLVEVNLEDL